MIKDRLLVALYSGHGLQRAIHFVAAGVLYRLPEGVRRVIFRGEKHYCPLCEAHLSTFLRLHRPYHLFCPVCRSLQRPRLIWLFLQQRSDLGNDAGKKLLHIAPEPALNKRLRQMQGLDYISGDLYDPKAMVKLDICSLQFPDNTFDVILCSHVLEHVEDDRKAMRELSRVLKGSGWAVILVPITARATIEDPSVTSPVERERLFGQFDHLRCYGPDFRSRLEANGFQVGVVPTTDLAGADEVERFGLSQSDEIFLCQKDQ
jgi:SAM-dependent methyltransferase